MGSMLMVLLERYLSVRPRERVFRAVKRASAAVNCGVFVGWLGSLRSRERFNSGSEAGRL
jgi:hypothetical protein